MQTARTIFRNKYQKIFSSDIRREFRENFDMLKRYNNMFGKKSSFLKNKKFILKGTNFYKSFFNSSVPYNYIKVPSEKNTYLICYNGGPQVYSYVESEKLNKEMDTKEIIFGDKKPCGCFNKLYVPKLKRCLSNLDNYRIKENYNFKRPNSAYKANFQARNLNCRARNREWTPRPTRYNTGSNTYGLIKKVMNSKNNYQSFSTNYMNRDKINYENSKNDNNDDGMSKRNKYDTLLYKINKNINKKFHKTQIFNNCKPFLSEGL